MKRILTASLLLMSATFCMAQGSYDAAGAGAASQQTNANRINPFFQDWDVLPYRIPPFSQIRDMDYLPALREGINRQNEAVLSILQSPGVATFENTIVALDNSADLINKVAGVLFNVAEAQSSEALQKIQAEAMQLLSKQSDNVYMNRFLFDRVKYLKEEGVVQNSVQQKLLDDTYRDFVLSGAELGREEQAALREVNMKISDLENTFSQNLLKATAAYSLFVPLSDKDRLAGLPEDDLQRAADKAAEQGRTGYAFGLDNPTIMPFLQYVKDAALRKEILDAYTSRCAAGSEFDNTVVVKELVNLRLKKANLLGFPDYASYALQSRMAQTPQAAYKLMNRIWPAAIERAKQELDEMTAYRKKYDKRNSKAAFLPSDWRYYANLVREQKYALDENLVREYFSVDNVRNGIFYLCERLYGIRFEKLENVEYPTPDTEAWLCKDEDGTVLGVIYLDMVARPGFKAGGAWNTNYVEQAYDADGKRLGTVTSIVCNYTPATGDKPTLLNIDETQTFFHEFGHALNMLLAEVSYKGLARIPTDFVELPSQIMEHWAMHPLMLRQYARHYKTGEVIPDDLVERIGQVLNFGQGFATTELLAAAILDMDYHTIRQENPDIDPDAFEAATAERLGLIPEIYPRYKTPYFNHTMGGGYSAGYYSYIWAEVLDCDGFEAFVESGDIFNKQVAKSFRDNVLKAGAMYPAMEMYVRFRGHEPDAKALLRSRGLDQ